MSDLLTLHRVTVWATLPNMCVAVAARGLLWLLVRALFLLFLFCTIAVACKPKTNQETLIGSRIMGQQLLTFLNISNHLITPCRIDSMVFEEIWRNGLCPGLQCLI